MKTIRLSHGLMLVLLALLAGPALAAEKAAPAIAYGGEASLTEQEREMLALAQDFSAKCTAAIEAWLAKKEISTERLFAALYYPIANTEPMKFNTDWDQLSDRDIQAIEEAVLGKSSTIVFAFMVDRNGYVPTHNLRYSLPLTGNRAADLLSNRGKRLLSDRTGLAAARNVAPYLLQHYQQDTGDSFMDLSVPIVVRGQHWGAVRIGFRLADR